MKSPWMRRLAVVVVLGCGGAQPASGTALFASALALGLHGDDHAHSVSLVAEEGHAHLVLSHAEHGARDQGGAPHHDDPSASFSEADHVFHLTNGDAANATPRRASLDPAPPLAIPVAAPFAPPPTRALRPAPDPVSLGSATLRAVVLRL